ncbi:DNA polymerase III subunit delta' [Pullulanibacillus camelliae]|uniref:DNA polymerase III subunit delta' n=1 Tax=Pullulanibacillus camelliae TaxID=1707096 RepID=A0A8J2YN41_9BACL|nr:DNA polymerase III subunit delta' [Pullulanibacillus camelliae]GGE53882.1 DNA polymerase III subunit delta' [Pullulanibacillus camelliae]
MKWQDVEAKQKKVAKILTNGLKSDRLVHAYLFIGDRGTGKKDVAQLFACSYFCQNKQGIDPCGQCSECKRILSGNHPDLMVVKPDGRSIKKEQVATLIKEFTYRGVESNKKFFIIEQADELTASAANSLLKFIEEPQSQTIAILCAENRHKLLDTIISRCQLIQFAPLSPEAIESQLIEEGFAKALARTVTALTGDINEARALCGDEWFANARSSVIHFMEDLYNQSNHAIITLYEQVSLVLNDSAKAQTGLDLMVIWMRDVLNIHMDRGDAVIFSDQIETLKKQALILSVDHVAGALSIILDAKRRLDSNSQPISVIEQLALRLQEGAGSYV